MTNKDWKISNERSHYESLKKQEIEYRKLIRDLQKVNNNLKLILVNDTWKHEFLIDFAHYVNKNELKESSEKITDYSITNYLKNKLDKYYINLPDFLKDDIKPINTKIDNIKWDGVK